LPTCPRGKHSTGWRRVKLLSLNLAFRVSCLWFYDSNRAKHLGQALLSAGTRRNSVGCQSVDAHTYSAAPPGPYAAYDLSITGGLQCKKVVREPWLGSSEINGTSNSQNNSMPVWPCPESNGELPRLPHGGQTQKKFVRCLGFLPETLAARSRDPASRSTRVSRRYCLSSSISFASTNSTLCVFLRIVAAPRWAGWVCRCPPSLLIEGVACAGNFVPADKLEKLGQEGPGMAKRKYTTEETVALLRQQVEVSMANGRTTPQADWESGIYRADLLSVAPGVRRAEARAGQTAQGIGEGELAP
jgi:hypothetical protein